MKAAFLKVLGGIVIALGMTSQANAGTISLKPAAALLSGTETSQNAINDIISAYFIANYGSDLTRLYKDNVGSEEGPTKDWYNTTYDDPLLPNANATISHVASQPWITGYPIFALMKDGKTNKINTDAWYLFKITDWNGKDSIQFSEFFNGNQDRISSVQIYGRQQSVPDGGPTAILFGAAIVVMASFRRMLS